jgi:serine/threonine protein kinase
MADLNYQPGHHLDNDYRIIEQLGRGAFSWVYKVDNFARSRQSVLKLLDPINPKESSIKLFQQECDALEGLNHPRIAKLLSYGRLRNDVLFIELEYIEGPTVQTLLENANKDNSIPPLKINDARQAILDLLDALIYLHEELPKTGEREPILHRDIKPNNLILNPERGLVIIDFNVSHVFNVDHPALTEVGTSGYKPPEIKFHNQPWTPKSDLFSVGVVLFQILTGQMPYERYSINAVPKNPSSILKELNPAISKICLKAINYEPGDRYSSAREMKKTIEREWPLEYHEPLGKIAQYMETEPISPLTADLHQLEVRRLLQVAKEANDNGQFLQTDVLLAQAKQATGANKSLLAEYQSVATGINTQRAQRAQQLSQEIATLLESVSPDEAQIPAILDELTFLDSERAQIFQVRFANKLQEQRNRQFYLEVKTECEALWRRAEELIAASTPYPTVLSQTYDKAVRVAEQAAATSEIPELEGLLRDAKRAQEQARNRFEVLSTAAEAGAYKEMMDVLNREKDDNKMIQLIGPGSILLGTMTVREARQQVTIMAEEFAHRKAMGYLEAARIHMEAHTPGAAKIELDRSNLLFMLNDEDKRRIQNYREKTVLPELTRFQAAQQLLEKARQTINPIESWQLIDKAYEQYEWLHDFDEVRVSLLPRLQTTVKILVSQLSEAFDPERVKSQSGQLDTIRAKQLVEQAQEAARLANLMTDYVEQSSGNVGLMQQKAHDSKRLADEAQAAAATAGATETLAPEQHASAQARAELARTYAQLAETTAGRLAKLKELQQPLHQLRQQTKALQQKAQEQQQLVQELDKATQELRQLLQANPGAAGNRWQALVTQFGKLTLEAFGPLNRLARDLEVRLNVEGLIARLKQDFASNNPTRLSQAIENCIEAAALKENLDFTDELATLHGQLESRLAYLLGQSNMQTGDAAAALKELAKVTAGVDVDKARLLEKEIHQELARDREVKHALDKAKKTLPTNPHQAYKDLKPYESTLSRYHEDVVGTLTEARANWEVQVLQKLQEGLNQPLDEDKVEDLRRLEKELHEGLGITGHRLAKRVLAYCFAYEARLAADLKEWEAAIDLWQKAIELDRKPEYVNGQTTAQKRHAEQLVREAPEAAALIIRELQKEIHDDPELQYWAARLFVQQAQKPGISANEAESLYRQAIAEIAVGLEQMSERSGVQWAQLKGQLDALQRDTRNGLDVEQQKQQIERRLVSNRTVREFHNARQDAEDLLRAYPHYPRQELPALPVWWRGLRQGAISKLEIEANQIPADQIWKRFDPLGKILALDEGHSQATGMLTQIGSLVRDLEREVDAFAKNNEGLDVHATSDMEVLPKQIGVIQDIQRRSDAVYATLIHFANHPILSKQSGTALATLNTLSSNLLVTQDRFDRFNRLKNQAQGALLTGRGSGDWSTFDRLLNEIAEAGFSAHRTTNALRRQRDHDQQRRQELQGWAKELENQAQQGNYIAALRLADRLQDKDTGDRDDEFGVQRRIRYHDSLNSQVWQGLGRVRPLLENKVCQLETINGWLLKCGLRKLSEEHNLTTDVNLLTQAPTIIDWESQKEMILADLKRGRFRKAIEQCEKVDHGNPVPNTLSLADAVSQLNIPPLSFSEVESDLARTLLTAADQEQIKLQTARTDVMETIALLNQQHREWEDRWHAFTLANIRLRQTQNSKNPVGKTNRVQTAQAAYNHALYACTEICPEHPDLQGIKRVE